MSSKKWVETVVGWLNLRALSSVEMERRLKPMFRHAPNARIISATLGSDGRFQRIDQTVASSLYRTRSHKVNVWGLRGCSYQGVEPYDRT